MAIKKSDLYSSLWASCDELRGGMDASQYKDYVLVLLFVKYVSDKYAGKKYAEINVPPGSSFSDMVALKGKPDIGDQINKKIIEPLADANGLADMPDFNDDLKLGRGKEKVDRLTNLIAIFQNPALDFSSNRAEGDDLLGDAYEYLMRHFATESGKSKGQFYTPSEVSQIIAKIVGIGEARTTAQTTIYDPTCGSGSLLLKVADEAHSDVTVYGQEKDATTSGLARMNMILHRQPTAEIVQGNTLADPKFKDGDHLKLFDYVVANPPFSDKRWSNGIDPESDPFGRFSAFGVPPTKQGDYAYLLHIVASLKSTGTGACILPHGVLFRGNTESTIRDNLVRKGYIVGIVGLPANLFYGTAIPACIVVIDKKSAARRDGIFMIDASAGFMKDGPKNRLRARDIHKIVDVFTRRLEVPKYSRMVPLAEIEKNGCNLNIPRYVDGQVAEDIQDIAGHLHGGIPVADIDALEHYWKVCPDLRTTLFKHNRDGYVDLAVEKPTIESTIYEHPQFKAFIAAMNKHFSTWGKKTAALLKELEPGFHPKELITQVAEDLQAHYLGNPLIDPYAVYQHLMDFWADTMQDDCYFIATDGWKAETQRVLETSNKTGKTRDKGWVCELVPKELVVRRYFAEKQCAIDDIATALENVTAELEEMAAAHGTEGGALDLDTLKRSEVSARLDEIANDGESRDEAAVLNSWLNFNAEESDLKKRLKVAEAELDSVVYSKFQNLAEAEIKALVVEDKWLGTLDAAIHSETNRVSQQLTKRLQELTRRYESPLLQIARTAIDLEQRIDQHLQRVELLTGDRRLAGFGEPWQTRKLSEIVRNIPSGTYGFDKASDGMVPVKVATTAHISDDDTWNQKPMQERYISPDNVERYRVKLGDLVVVKSSGSAASIKSGKMALVSDRQDGKFVFSNFLMILRPTAIRPEFLYFYLTSYNVKKLLPSLVEASTYPNIRIDEYLALEIPVPPDNEQVAISAVLSEMDAENMQLHNKIEKFRRIKQGLMQALLTGKTRLV